MSVTETTYKTSLINNRRYLGNKYKLLSFITGVVNDECVDIETVADIFAGTGAVSSAFADKTLITNDLMYSNYICSEGKVNYDQYFLGTMLFSTLSDRFIQINQNTLSEQIFKYIMTTNDDGEVVRIIQSKTHYPFFSFYIQEREKTNIENPSTEEEQCIKETYEYLYNSWFYNKCWGQAHCLTPTFIIESLKIAIFPKSRAEENPRPPIA